MEKQASGDERPATTTAKSAGVLRLEQESPEAPPSGRRRRSDRSSTGSTPTIDERTYGAPPAEAAGTDRDAAAELLEELGTSGPEPEPAAAASPDELRALLVALFTAWNLCAELRPTWERWKLTERERKLLVEAWLPVAVKYDTALRIGPEVAAVAVTVAVLAPRFRAPDEPSATEPRSSEHPGYLVQ